MSDDDFKFDVMETVYIAESARRGFLEKVTIKLRFSNSGYNTAGQPVTDVHVYETTFNRVFLEGELLTLEEATDIIEG
jgi:hypothetical protein